MSKIVKETLAELGIDHRTNVQHIVLTLAARVVELQRRVDQLERGDPTSLGSRFKDFVAKVAPPMRPRV